MFPTGTMEMMRQCPARKAGGFAGTYDRQKERCRKPARPGGKEGKRRRMAYQRHRMAGISAALGDSLNMGNDTTGGSLGRSVFSGTAASR